MIRGWDATTELLAWVMELVMCHTDLIAGWQVEYYGVQYANVDAELLIILTEGRPILARLYRMSDTDEWILSLVYEIVDVLKEDEREYASQNV